MKNILVTGANSYIGTSFEKYMAQWPEEYQVDTIDMVDGSWRGKSFTDYDSVLHVAGIAHISTKKLDQQGREKYWQVNAFLPVDIAQKAMDEGVKQFIFLSSMSVYGEHGSIKHPVVITKETEPTSKDIYGKSKLKAEEGLQLLSSKSFSVCVLRPPMIYGQGCKGNYQLLRKAALRLPIFPDINNERSILFIDNFCAFMKVVLDDGLSGIHFPQNSEYACTSEMVRQIALAHGRKVRLTKAFNPLLRLLSGRVNVADKVFGSLLYDKSLSFTSSPYNTADFRSSIYSSEGIRPNANS